MSILLTLRSVAHSASGAPQLWGAARRAGASRTQAAGVLHLTGLSLAVAARRGAGVPGRSNAVRHFVWQAALTARHDRDLAVALAAQQERGTPNTRDSAVDEHNNAVGQRYGEHERERLRALTAKEVVDHLATVGLTKWDSGDLRWIR